MLTLRLRLLSEDRGVLGQGLVKLHHIMVVVELRCLLLGRILTAWNVSLLHLQ